MKITKNHLAVACLSTLLAACGGDSDSNNDNDNQVSSYVRVLHASPDAPNVDVLVDGNAVLTNVAFQQGSGYLQLDSGRRNVKVRVNGTDTIVLDENFSLGENGYYSVIAQGLVASAVDSETELELEVIDDTENRNNGVNDVTVVHAAPSAGNVNVFVTADGVELPTNAGELANFEFDDDETLTSIASGDYQVRITGVNSPDVVYNSSTLPVATDVTAVAVKSTKGVSPVSLLIWADSQTPVTPVLDATAEVRIVHAVDAVDVDVFAGGNELLSDFSYKDATGYVVVASGELPVAIAPADQDIGNAIPTLSGKLPLKRGESYTVIAAGDATKNQLIVLNDQREVSAAGKADVRLVHAAAASAADPVDIYVAATGADISNNEPTFADVIIGQDTGYTALEGTTAYQVVIAADNTTAPAITGLDNVTFGADSVTTAIAIGNASGLDKIILDDERTVQMKR